MDTKQKGTPSEPLVSIVTPVRNGITYLETCLQSVLNQSYPNIEHIIVDGGSTDGSLDMIERYQAKYADRIRLITGRDKGIGDAVNKGLKAAKGEIMGWIDSDDVYEPDAIRTVVEFFRSHAEAYFVYGGCNMIDEKGKVTSCFIVKDFNLRVALNYSHYVNFCSSFYKRRVLAEAGYFNNLGNDLDFFIRVHRKFRMYRIEPVLANWRLHGGGITGSANARETGIRKERLRQDFFLALRYGGSITSPRASRYTLTLLAEMKERYGPLANTLRPVLGWSYPAVKKIVNKAVRLGFE